MYKPVFAGINRVGLHQRIFAFDNGYGASVVEGPFAYGHGETPYELAILQMLELGLGKLRWKICYTTELTDDVIGNLDEAGVVALLQKIEQLPDWRKEGKANE